MNSVLEAFKDKVLILKHMSNGVAIDGLEKQELVAIEADVNELIDEMNTSIAEADSFIQSLPNFSSVKS